MKMFFNAYRSAQGWIVTATHNGETRYLQNVRNGEYKFNRNSLFARAVTRETASKYLSDLLGEPFVITPRSEGKKAWVVREIMKKGWSNDEAIMIMERIFRQYENNVMGLSILSMVKSQPTKAEWTESI